MCSPHSWISARIQDGGHSAYGGHFDFLRTTIFSNNSPKSKCNTSKVVDSIISEVIALKFNLNVFLWLIWAV